MNGDDYFTTSWDFNFNDQLYYGMLGVDYSYTMTGYRRKLAWTRNNSSYIY